MLLNKLFIFTVTSFWILLTSSGSNLAYSHEVTSQLVSKSATTAHYIYLTRHAEKQDDGTRDPSLTKEGQQRAENLVLLLKDKNITQVYSTNYQRTQQTAKPFADHLKVDAKIYDPQQLQDFANKVLLLSENVLIVGHSNTTPQLAAMLGGDSMSEMSESEYGRIYQLKIVGDIVTTHLINSSNH